VAVAPGRGFLELRADAQQHVFAAVRGSELHTDRKT
jgi:hypothetical protein